MTVGVIRIAVQALVIQLLSLLQGIGVLVRGSHAVRGRCQVIIGVGVVRIVRHRLLEFFHRSVVLSLLVETHSLHVLAGGHHTASTGDRHESGQHQTDRAANSVLL